MTPRFSVVMPVHNVRQYLPDAVASVAAQGRDDVELIAVDDGSVDGSREWLESAAEPWVIPLLTDANVGPGTARDLGVARARGDYVLFLDSDDLMLPGLLDAVASAADTSGSPDLILFDHVRLYPDGSQVPSPGAAVLDELAGTVTSLDSSPELLSLINVVWNKAFRRDWLERAGLRFPSGIYEDIPYSVQALAAAPGIAVLGIAGVAYRVRPGSTVGSTSSRQRQVFEQWRLAWDRAEPELLPPTRAALYDAMLRQLVGLYLAGRVPPDERTEYLRSARDLLNDKRPEGWSAESRYWALREAAIRRGGPRAFEALAAASRARDRAAERWASDGPAGLASSGAGMLQRRIAAGPVYRRALGKELRDAVVFESWAGKQCADNPRAIYDELTRGPVAPLPSDCEFIWVIADDSVPVPADPRDDRTRAVVRGTADYYRALGTSRWIVSNDCEPPWLVKRDGARYLQTWHGTPLKRIGFTAEHLVTKNPHYLDDLARDADKWDALVVPNEFSAEVLPEALGFAGPELRTGYPRNDVFFHAERAQARRAHAARALGIDLADPRPIILYAPTWRDGQVNAAGQYAQSVAFDVKAAAAAFGAQYQLVVRAHHQIRDGLLPSAGGGSGWAIDASGYPEAADLCLLADLLLTDYSSIMFDFACTGRPIALYCPDLEQQSRFGRGFYLGAEFWEHTPGPLCLDQESLFAALAQGPQAMRESHRHDYEQFAGRFCSWEDGGSARRVIDAFFGP